MTGRRTRIGWQVLVFLLGAEVTILLVWLWSGIVFGGDPRFDGGPFAITAKTANTFSYAAPSFAVTSWAVSGNVATLTATTPPHGLAVGDVVTVANFTGGGAPNYLDGVFTVTAVTASTLFFG